MPQMLEAITIHAHSLEEVRKPDLRSGDRVLVTTRNSLYKIWVLAEGVYRVTGGWFDLQRIAPLRIGINGCTWGGSALKRDVIAALGLRLEFENSVRTTRIRRIRLIRAAYAESTLN
jgi:hypothetical protein